MHALTGERRRAALVVALALAPSSACAPRASPAAGEVVEARVPRAQLAAPAAPASDRSPVDAGPAPATAERAGADRPYDPGRPTRPSAPPAPSDDYVRALESLDDGLVTAEVRLDAEGGAIPILLEVERQGVATVRLTLGGRREGCGVVDVSLDAVPGAPSPLLFLQRFCENGEDELSREIDAYVLHPGDATSGLHVLWEGGGSFRSSFGVCEQIDVPEAEIVRPGVLRVRRWTEVIARPNPRRLGGGACAPLPPARRTIFESRF